MHWPVQHSCLPCYWKADRMTVVQYYKKKSFVTYWQPREGWTQKRIHIFFCWMHVNLVPSNVKNLEIWGLERWMAQLVTLLEVLNSVPGKHMVLTTMYDRIWCFLLICRHTCRALIINKYKFKKIGGQNHLRWETMFGAGSLNHAILCSHTQFWNV